MSMRDLLINERNIRIMREAKYITLQNVRDELTGEIEYMMNEYFEENELPYSDCEIVLAAHEHFHSANKSDGWYYDFIDDDMFLKCIGLSTGKTTIEAVLEQFEYYLEVQESRNILETMDFDWETYCQYCYTTIIRDSKLSSLSTL